MKNTWHHTSIPIGNKSYYCNYLFVIKCIGNRPAWQIYIYIYIEPSAYEGNTKKQKYSFNRNEYKSQQKKVYRFSFIWKQYQTMYVYSSFANFNLQRCTKFIGLDNLQTLNNLITENNFIILCLSGRTSAK